MNDNADLSAVAEAKTSSRGVQTNLDKFIKRQIDEFAGMAETIREQAEIIEKQQRILEAIEKKLERFATSSDSFVLPVHFMQTSPEEKIDSILGCPADKAFGRFRSAMRVPEELEELRNKIITEITKPR